MTTKTRDKKAGWMMMETYLDGRNVFDVMDDVVRYISSIALQQADNVVIPAIERLVDAFTNVEDDEKPQHLEAFLSLLMRIYFALPDEKVVRESDAPPANDQVRTVLRGTKHYLVTRISNVFYNHRDPLCDRTRGLERTYVRFLADAAYPAEQRAFDPSVRIPYDRSHLATRFVSEGEREDIVEVFAKDVKAYNLRRIECQLSVVGLPTGFLFILGQARIGADPLQVEYDVARKRALLADDDPRYAILEYEAYMRNTEGWIEGIRCIPLDDIRFTQDPDGHHWVKIVLQATAEKRLCEALMDALPQRIAAYKAAHPELVATLSFQIFIGDNNAEERGA